MPADKALIFNMALAHAGVKLRILDPENETGPEAENCRLFYDHVLGIIIESMPWPFLTRRQTLQSLGSPPEGWLFRYKYPATCRRINKIVNPVSRLITPSAPPIPYAIQNLTDAYGKSILTDQEDAVLEFNEDIDDPGLFTATFVQAHTIGLAAHIVTPLRVDAKLADRVLGQWSAWLEEAAAQAMREQEDDEMPTSQFEGARG